MPFHRRMLYKLRNKVAGLAHHERLIETKWHDRLEFIAYKIIDPLIWM